MDAMDLGLVHLASILPTSLPNPLLDARFGTHNDKLWTIFQDHCCGLSSPHHRHARLPSTSSAKPFGPADRSSKGSDHSRVASQQIAPFLAHPLLSSSQASNPSLSGTGHRTGFLPLTPSRRHNEVRKIEYEPTSCRSFADNARSREHLLKRFLDKYTAAKYATALILPAW